MTCNYSCKKPDGTSVTVPGTHKEWYWLSDYGWEGLCIGYYGRLSFSSYANKEVFNPEGYNSFDPEKSESENLTNWAKGNCDECKK